MRDSKSEIDFEEGYLVGALARFWEDENLSFKDFLRQERQKAREEKKIKQIQKVRKKTSDQID